MEVRQGECSSMESSAVCHWAPIIRAHAIQIQAECKHELPKATLGHAATWNEAEQLQGLESGYQNPSNCQGAHGNSLLASSDRRDA